MRSSIHAGRFAMNARIRLIAILFILLLICAIGFAGSAKTRLSPEERIVQTYKNCLTQCDGYSKTCKTKCDAKQTKCIQECRTNVAGNYGMCYENCIIATPDCYRDCDHNTRDCQNTCESTMDAQFQKLILPESQNRR